MQVIRLRPFLTKAFLLLTTIALLGACKTYSEDDKNGFDQKISSYAAKKGWNVSKTDSGLFIEQLNEGDGEEVQYESIVFLQYKGKLLSGKTVDQSLPGKPLESKLNGLIAGFQEALLGQKKGAKMRLIIPPQLGYGDEAYGKIPANSILVFELEVVDVK